MAQPIQPSLIISLPCKFPEQSNVTPPGIIDVALRKLPTPPHNIRKIDESRTFTPVLPSETPTSTDGESASVDIDSEDLSMDVALPSIFKADAATLALGEPYDPVLPHISNSEEESMCIENKETAVVSESTAPPSEGLFNMFEETTYQETANPTQF